MFVHKNKIIQEQEDQHIGVEVGVQDHHQEEDAAMETNDPSDISSDDCSEEEDQGAAAPLAAYVFHGSHLARAPVFFGAEWFDSLSSYEKRDAYAFLAKLEIVDTPAKTSDLEAVIRGIFDMHICYVMFTLPRWFTIAKMWVARNKLLGIAVPNFGFVSCHPHFGNVAT